MSWAHVTTPAAQMGYSRTTDWPTQGGLAMTAPTTSSKFFTVGNSQWHPTVAYMVGLVVAEMVVFHFLSRFLKI